MSTIKFGPTANKLGCSVISSCSLDNILAFGCRCEVVLLGNLENVPTYLGLFEAYGYKDKVASLSFCKKKEKQHRLVTGSDSGSLKVWNITKTQNGDMEHEILAEMNGFGKILSVDWIASSSEQVLCASDTGQLTLCNYAVKKYISFSPKLKKFNHEVLLAIPSPSRSNIAAVGYKGGLILIVDIIRSGVIVQELHGHEDDIASISWCTTEHGGQYDLASSSTDGTLRVWNIEAGRALKTITLAKMQHQGRGNKKFDKSKYMAPIAWVPGSDTELLYGTYSGDLFLVELEEQGKSQVCLATTSSVRHSRCIFSMAVGSSFACTFAVDRQLIIWDLSSRKAVFCLPEIAGYVYAIDSSFPNPNMLALGIGEATLRVWDISDKSPRSRLQTHWLRSNGKVTVVSWHPELENVLAFGMQDGKVGVFDSRYDKIPKMSNTLHGNSVYSLSWGTLPVKYRENKASTTKLYLYSAGDSRIFIHDPNALSEMVFDFNDIASLPSNSRKARRCEVSWKPDLTAVAVGNDDGVVEIYDEELHLIAQTGGRGKMVQCLRWHPRYTHLSTSVSEFNCFLACSSNDKAISVYDLKPHLANKGESVKKSDSPSEFFPVHVLSGHKDTVACVSWSMHKDLMLASASYDRCARVWNVVKGTCICSFSGHVSRLFSVHWNPLDPDLVITGGEDYTVQEWSISKQMSCKQARKGIRKSIKDIQKPTEIPSVNSVSQTVNQRNNFPEKDDSADTAKSIEPEKVKIQGGSNEEKRQKPTSLLPLTGTAGNQGKAVTLKDHLLLAHYHFPDGRFKGEEFQEALPSFGTGDLVHLGMFAGQEHALQLLDSEIKYHQDNNRIDYAMHLAMWTGDIRAHLRKAAENRTLTCALVALAPLVSRQLWLEMCEKYAEQLMLKKEFHKAVTYLLACHKVYEAIQVLYDNQLFKEALILAKARLPPSDPVIQDILKCWAEFALKISQPDLATKCHLALKDAKSATKLLASRLDARFQSAAAYISRHCNFEEDAHLYALMSLRNSLCKKEWDLALKITEEHEKYVPCKLLVNVHKLILQYHESLEESAKEGAADVDEPSNALIWKGIFIDGAKLVNKLYEECMAIRDVEVDEACEVILQVGDYGEGVPTSSQVVLKVATHLTVAQLKLRKPSDNTRLLYARNIAKALAACQNPQFYHSLCKFLFPSALHMTNEMAASTATDALENQLSAKACLMVFGEVWLRLLQDCFPDGINCNWISEAKHSKDENFEGRVCFSPDCILASSVLAYFASNLLDKICDDLETNLFDTDQTNPSPCLEQIEGENALINGNELGNIQEHELENERIEGNSKSFEGLEETYRSEGITNGILISDTNSELEAVEIADFDKSRESVLTSNVLENLKNINESDEMCNNDAANERESSVIVSNRKHKEELEVFTLSVGDKQKLLAPPNTLSDTETDGISSLDLCVETKDTDILMADLKLEVEKPTEFNKEINEECKSSTAISPLEIETTLVVASSAEVSVNGDNVSVLHNNEEGGKGTVKLVAASANGDVSDAQEAPYFSPKVQLENVDLKIRNLMCVVCSVMPFLLNDLCAKQAACENMLLRIEQTVGRKIASHMQQQCGNPAGDAESDTAIVGDQANALERQESHPDPSSVDIDYLEMDILTLQKLRQSVRDEMQSIEDKLQGVPFPDSFISVKKVISTLRMFLSVCHDATVVEKVRKVSHHVAVWALEYFNSEENRKDFLQYVETAH